MSSSLCHPPLIQIKSPKIFWGSDPLALDDKTHTPPVTWLTQVDVVISSALAVHLVDEEAGHGLQEQAEDGHTGAEAEQVPPPVDCQFVQRVEDPKMDDVGQYCHHHPH